MTNRRIPTTCIEPGAGAEYVTPWGEQMACKVVGHQSGGAFMMSELRTEAGWNRPSYVRHDADECWYVLEGSFDMQVEDRGVLSVTTGCVLYIPRGVARGMTGTDRAGGRLLVVQTPGEQPETSSRGSGIEFVEPPSPTPDLARH